MPGFSCVPTAKFVVLSVSGARQSFGARPSEVHRQLLGRILHPPLDSDFIDETNESDPIYHVEIAQASGQTIRARILYVKTVNRTRSSTTDTGVMVTRLTQILFAESHLYRLILPKCNIRARHCGPDFDSAIYKIYDPTLVANLSGLLGPIDDTSSSFEDTQQSADNAFTARVGSILLSGPTGSGGAELCSSIACHCGRISIVIHLGAILATGKELAGTTLKQVLQLAIWGMTQF
jgi:hypothetical protein